MLSSLFVLLKSRLENSKDGQSKDFGSLYIGMKYDLVVHSACDNRSDLPHSRLVHRKCSR